MTIRFIENNLAPGEQLVYRVQPHWIIFIKPLFFTLALIIFGRIFAGNMALVYIAIPVAFIVWIAKFIEYTCSEFGVTNKRVLSKTGLIHVDVIDTLLQRIESVQVYQSLLGKILGYGVVTICGTGGDRYPFMWIKNPMLFRSHAQEQMSHLGTA
jgi:uncharacterized membrane protein YdbT with pleckstrin-like domain